MNYIGNVKLLTHIGYEKTVLAKMATEELQTVVDRFVSRLMNRVDEKDENGRPTGRALSACNALEDYLDDQMGMFKSRGLLPSRAYREAIVPTGEYFCNVRGEDVEKFRIVPRKNTLEPTEAIETWAASVRVIPDGAQRECMERELHRGKYNDGHLNVEMSTASVDRSEALGFGID